jgi:hypothetical protein
VKRRQDAELRVAERGRAALAVVASRRVAGRPPREQLESAAALPAIAVLTSLLAWLLIHERYVAEALIVVAMFVSIASRIAPPAIARTARLLTLPMLVLFVAPAPVHRGFWIDLPWYVIVSAIAGAWVLLASGLIAAPPQAPAPRPQRSGVVVRIAGQSALGLALAFATSQALFPHRWTWAIVTAFAVSGGARSRGHVLLRSGERLVGAVTGTIVATVIAETLSGHTVASVVAIFGLLGCGAVLAEVHYVFWAFCVTSMLALLYGLYGQAGTHLLDERLAQNLLGAGCMIAPAFLLLPVRTESVVRRYAALTLAAVDHLRSLLAAPDRDEAAVVAAVRDLDERAAMLDAAAAPALAGHRIARAVGLSSHDRSVALVGKVRAAVSHVRALAVA